MDEQDKNKIKVLDVFQPEESKDNTEEKSHIFNKLEFTKGIIQNAIVSRYSHQLPKAEDKEKDKKNSIIFREQCEYCLTNFSISGNLILTKESLLFEPDLRDSNVISKGFGTYQIFIDLYDIYECAHIVVPTQNTYLSNDEDMCGFIQVLLKSCYNKETEEGSNNNSVTWLNLKKNASNSNDSSKKGASYYKYISKSLSFVYNLAHPLVQNSSVKDSKVNKNEINNSCSNTNSYANSISNSHIDFKAELKSVEAVEPSTKNSKEAVDVQNLNLKKESTDDEVNKPKKHSLINFDSECRKNIVKHLKDHELKIYQKFSTMNYTHISSSLPLITYKNDLNLVESVSLSKQDTNGLEGSTDELFDTENNKKEKKEHTDKPQCETSNNELWKENKENTQDKSKKRENKENVRMMGEVDQTMSIDSGDTCMKKIHESENEMNPHLDQCNRMHETKINYSGSNHSEASTEHVHYTHQDCSHQSNEIKSEDTSNRIFFQMNDNDSTKREFTNVVNDTEEHCMEKTEERTIQTERENTNLVDFPTHEQKIKTYEEKSFVLFRFFNNNRAYETTTKIIKEIDEVRNRENTMRKTISSVPFTSNELLHFIIEQSLKGYEPMRKESKASKSKEQKYQVIQPKLEHIRGSIKLLNKATAKQINYYLPPRISIKIWKLAFCTSMHGISFKTLYRSVNDKGCVLLLIYDMNNVMFGYFMDRLSCENGYYGSGENFLFTFKDTKSKETNHTIDHLKVPCNKHKHSSVRDSETPEESTLMKANISKDSMSEIGTNNVRDSSPSNIFLRKGNGSNTFIRQTELLNIKEGKKKDSRGTSGSESANSQSKNGHSEYGDFKNPSIFQSEHSSTNTNEYKTQNGKKKNRKFSDKMQLNSIIGKLNEQSNQTIQVYLWSTKNSYFIYSDEESIMIGGGDNYALIINEDLRKGQTGKSSTYDNDLLTYEEEFEIQFLQLWTFEDY